LSCRRCFSPLKIIRLIDAPALIERILRHLFLLQLLFGFAGFPSRRQVSVLSLRIQRKAIS
jgi:hypothetical protein